MSKYELQGYLEKRGVGAIGLGWKRRWFAIKDDNLYYYDIHDDMKEYRGCIDISTITKVAPKDDDPAGEKWRFYLDTPTRRYDLKAIKGEYEMWYWIEGIRNIQNRIASRKLSQEQEERKNRKTREANDFVFSDLQIQVQNLKDELKTAQEEKKVIQNEYKRFRFLHKKEMAKKKDDIAKLQAKLYQITPDEGPEFDDRSSLVEVSNISAIDEKPEDTKDAFELLQSAEEEIHSLKKRLTEQSNEFQKELKELQKSRDQDELIRRRLENEILDLRQKLELEINIKTALQHNNRELDNELRQLQRLSQLRTSNGPPWVPDWYVESCQSCNVGFSILKRKHHCRNCGNVFCSKCSGYSAILPSSFYPNVRVRICNGCYSILTVRKSSDVANISNNSITPTKFEDHQPIKM